MAYISSITPLGSTTKYDIKAKALDDSVVISPDKIDGIVPIEKGGTGNADGYIRTGAQEDSIIGQYATAEGYQLIASGESSHAEGANTVASGTYSHVEGLYTVAASYLTHAEGYGTRALGKYSHTEGQSSSLPGIASAGITITGDANAKIYNYTGTLKTNAMITKPYNYCYMISSTYINGMSIALLQECDTTNHTIKFDKTLSSTAITDVQLYYLDITNMNTAYGEASHVEGKANKALGNQAHAEGLNNTVTSDGICAHVEGCHNTASGARSHAEGYQSTASGSVAHAEGYQTTASGAGAHAQNINTTASGDRSHAEGYYATASGSAAHAEGYGTTASGAGAHAQNINTTASGDRSHAEGYYSTASGDSAHAEGRSLASGNYSHSESQSIASGISSHAEGIVTYFISFPISGAEGATTYERSDGGTLNDTVIGRYITTSTDYANLAPTDPLVFKILSVNLEATPNKTITVDRTMGALDGVTVYMIQYPEAAGKGSHVEGEGTRASGIDSHAEGESTNASGSHAHAEGSSTDATGLNSHAEGSANMASGYSSHAEGFNTIAARRSQHTFGEFNIEDTQGSSGIAKGQYIEIVGNGTSPAARSNARTLDWDGNEVLAGKLTVGAAPTNNMDVTTKQYVDTQNGNYVEKAGDSMTGNLTADGIATLGTSTNPWHQLVLGGATNDVMTAASTNPRITFQENSNGTQPVHLIYTDVNSYRTPAGLKVIGGTDATPAWFEVEGNIYAGGTLSGTNYIRPNQLNGIVNTTLQSLFNDARANRLMFLPADQIIIEQTIDGGQTWTDAGISDSVKLALFSQNRAAVYIPQINGEKNILCGLRVTFTAMKYDVPAGTAETQKYSYWNKDHVLSQERYSNLQDFYFFVNADANAIKVKIENATGADPNNWITKFENNNFALTGWSGNDYVKLSDISSFGGSTAQTTSPWNYRITFFTSGKNGSTTLANSYLTSKQSIQEIRGYGYLWWGAGSNFASKDHIYSWDQYQNTTFPAEVTATKFIGPATKLGTIDVGSNVKAIYLNAGVPTASDHEFAGSYQKNNADLNTLYDAGFYASPGGNVTNYPTGGDKFAATLVVPYRKPSGNITPDYAWQITSCAQSNDRLWYRTSTSVWRNWRQIVNIATNTAVGGTSQPVYVDADGKVQAITGSISNNAASASKVGSDASWLYFNYNNEINFGGTHTGTSIYFGHRATDSRPIPTIYIFGGDNGTAQIQTGSIINRGTLTNTGAVTFNATGDSTHSKDTAASLVVKGGISAEKQISAKSIYIDNNQGTAKGVNLIFDENLQTLNFVFA